MALNDISLTAGMRNNLISLQSTTTLLSRTQDRLSSGKKVNSALDNPTNFFAAQNHTQRAADLTTRKDGMTEAVQGVQAANKGITAITALIEAAKGLTQAARAADTGDRASLGSQFNEILTQISQLAADSGYKGKNFLDNQTLDVLFNESGGAKLTIAGFDATATTGLGISLIITGTAAVTGATTTGVIASLGTGIINFESGHVATINPVSAVTGYHATGTFSVTTTTAAATTGQDLFILDPTNVSGIDAVAYASLYTGAITADSVTINGVVTTGPFLVTGSSGTFTVSFTGTALSGMTATGAIVSFQVTISAYMADGSSAATAQNLYNFTLATGDIASGMSILSGGPNVYISGTYLADTNYTITGNTLVFNTGFSAPTATGAVTYDYNVGYTTGSATPATTYSTDFTGSFTTGADITSVMISGVAVTTGNYSIAGNVISFVTGFAPTTGQEVTYLVKAADTAAIAGGWTADTGIDNSVTALNSAIATLRTNSATLASNLSVVTIREDFTDGMVNTLLKGADNLTLADMNEEGANMLMLQTRQQLGTTSLKMASDAAQSVLRLF